MGIDILLIDPETEECFEEERIFNVQGFFHFADVLSRMAPMLRQIDDESDRPKHDAYRNYIDTYCKKGERRFKEYCTFTAKVQKTVARQFGGAAIGLRKDDFQPNPKLYDSDIRKLLGASVLGDRIIPTAEAQDFRSALVWVGTRNKRLQQMLSEDPEQKQILEWNFQSLSTMASFCKQAMAKSISLYFSC